MKTVYKENSKNRCDITEKSAAVGTASGNHGTKTVKTKKKSKIMPKNHSDSAVLYGTVARKLMMDMHGSTVYCCVIRLFPLLRGR